MSSGVISSALCVNTSLTFFADNKLLSERLRNFISAFSNILNACLRNAPNNLFKLFAVCESFFEPREPGYELGDELMTPYTAHQHYTALFSHFSVCLYRNPGRQVFMYTVEPPYLDHPCDRFEPVLISRCEFQLIQIITHYNRYTSAIDWKPYNDRS